MTPEPDRARLPPLLLVLTFTTGIVDAVSYLGLGHVFTANMTGNIVLLGFALAGEPGFSIAPLLVALAAFLVGAAVAGRLAGRHWPERAFLVEVALMAAAAVAAIGLGDDSPSGRRYAVIALLAFAMGIRNATVRRLAVPDLTTTVLTLTLTGLAADSRLAGGDAKNQGRRVTAVGCMLLGALAGAILLGSPVVPLAVAAGLQAGAVAVYMHPRPSVA